MLNGSLKLGVRLRKHGAYGWKMMSKMWGLEQESKMLAVNKNLNRVSRMLFEMLSNSETRCAQWDSKMSGSWTRFDWFPFNMYPECPK